MRLVSIAKCEAGMQIGKPIYTDNGTVLIGEGVSLTQRMIDSLSNRGVGMVYIKDKLTADLTITEDIPMELRIEASKSINETFSSISDSNHKWNKVVDNLNTDKLQQVLKTMIAELKKSGSALSLLTNIHIHDNYVFAHSVNVTIYTLAMAVKLGLDDKKLNDLAIGGMLHDIGKTMIPLEILNKKDKLTNEEFNEIKRHTEYGFEILRGQSSVPLLAAHCAFQHHEKLDGTGYPRKLKGNEIHQYAKIMAIADVFDALTSHRSYRNAMLPHDAMEIIFAGANTHFDSQLIQMFQKSVASYPIGVTVKLNTGETAVVVAYHFDAPGRPTVRILKDPNGHAVSNPSEIDLSKNLSLMITESDTIL
ncbi:HD-GYP domain-containing protein [Brevibacillus sp. NPDC058079]|uniref:HD-GYP domain-containing protein n=1 Tax=Brevibacillus sp. NPDC058079 TaxID=3346330 RepID=UPI0036E98488